MIKSLIRSLNITVLGAILANGGFVQRTSLDFTYRSRLQLIRLLDGVIVLDHLT